MQTKPQKLVVDLHAALSEVFDQVTEEGIHPDYVIDLDGRRFGCDDYGLLYRTLFKDREDVLSVLTLANDLRVLQGAKSMSNMEIANLIEAVAVVVEETNTWTVIKLEGFWITRP